MTYEITSMWNRWQNMSCRPEGKKRLAPETVIDEEKSVRWNREEVIRLNKEYEEEVARLSTQRNKLRDELFNKIYAYIVDMVGNNCNTEQAKVIWDYVYEHKHHSDFTEICGYLDDTIDFVSDLLEKSN